MSDTPRNPEVVAPGSEPLLEAIDQAMENRANEDLHDQDDSQYEEIDDLQFEEIIDEDPFLDLPPVDDIQTTEPQPEAPIASDITPLEKKNHGKKVALAAFLAGTLALSAFIFTKDDGKARAETTTSATNVPTPEEKAACIEKGTWAIEEADHGNNNRWFADGIDEIKTAKTADDAKNALLLWHDKVRRDPELLYGASTIFMKGEPVTANLKIADLRGKDNCISPQGQEVSAQLLTFMLAKYSVAPGEAPSNGFNTGADKNGVTTAANPGVGGDRKGIVLTDRETGEEVACIMGRCGQPVLPGQPDLPEGPTDEDEPTPTPFPNKTPQGTIPGSVPNQPGSGGSPEQGMDPQNDSDEDGYGPGDTRPTITPSPTPSGSNSPNQTPTPTPTSTYETNPSPRPTQSATASPNPTAQPSPSSTNTPPPPDN